MIRQIVQNYVCTQKIPKADYRFAGHSFATKDLIFYLFNDHSKDISILDIGFGFGTLGKMVKENQSTEHWQIDGVDGYEVACHNVELFNKNYYRHVWHGYAQELPLELLKKYNVICLLDVIEHLNAETAKKLLRTLLESLSDDSLLFISTPLWFFPQEMDQEGDLEEHLIGIPASSMMALQPIMYTLSNELVGSFVYTKNSLKFIDCFQPIENKGFTKELGERVAISVGMNLTPFTIHTGPV